MSGQQVATAELRFIDTDGDEVHLKFENGKINEYLNGSLEIEGVTFFNIDMTKRSYEDDESEGTFKPGEDLVALVRARDMLFQDQPDEEDEEEDSDEEEDEEEDGEEADEEDQPDTSAPQPKAKAKGKAATQKAKVKAAAATAPKATRTERQSGQVIIDKSLCVDWENYKIEGVNMKEYVLNTRVVIVEGKHRGKIGYVASLPSYFEEHGKMNVVLSETIQRRVGDAESEFFSAKEVQPLNPKVYVFSCKYDMAKAEKGNFGGTSCASKCFNCMCCPFLCFCKVFCCAKDSDYHIEPLTSAEMVQTHILANFSGSGTAEPDIIAQRRPGNAPIQQTMKGDASLDPPPFGKGSLGILDPMRYNKCPLVFNPNHQGLNWGDTNPKGDCVNASTCKNCNDTAANDGICDSFGRWQRGEEVAVAKLGDPGKKNKPCWRSNYYNALKKHKAMFQIVEFGELGGGQETEVRMGKALGIIPADFDCAANCRSRTTYVSPDRRFIRIHTTPKLDVSSGQEVCSGVASCVLCPIWCPLLCCTCGKLSLINLCFPSAVDAKMYNHDQIRDKLNETTLGRKR